jgi:hypothetical protein
MMHQSKCLKIIGPNSPGYLIVNFAFAKFTHPSPAPALVRIT